MSTKTDYTYSRRYVIFFLWRIQLNTCTYLKSLLPNSRKHIFLSICINLLFRYKNLDINLCSHQCVHRHKNFSSSLQHAYNFDNYRYNMHWVTISSASIQFWDVEEREEWFRKQIVHSWVGVVFMLFKAERHFKKNYFNKNCVSDSEAHGLDVSI